MGQSLGEYLAEQETKSLLEKAKKVKVASARLSTAVAEVTLPRGLLYRSKPVAE